MNIFEFTDYKTFVLDAIDSSPNLGRGSVKKIAEALRVHPSLISQILKGSKDFNAEQANEVASFLGLDDEATEYFLCLVEIERAGTSKLKSFLINKRERMRKAAKLTSAGATNGASGKLKTDTDRFYSNWYYSAVYLLAQIPKYQSIGAMAEYLKMPVSIVNEAVDVLSDLGMIKAEAGRVIAGASSLDHVACGDSKRFHMNWRLKGMDRLNVENSKEAFLTLPMALSNADRRRLQSMILDFADKVKEASVPAEAEQLSVVTIDLFDIA